MFGALAILILNHILSVSHSTSKFSIINSYLIRKLSQAGNKATGIGGVLGKGQKECVALMHEKNEQNLVFKCLYSSGFLKCLTEL